MTNINCSSNCTFQKDGKCTLEKISKKKITPDSSCAYFSLSKEDSKNN